MKFRYKVLITNLILLSVSLGLVGYLMIHKNFELAKETQISNAVIQNNLVQSSVEYEVLQALNRVAEEITDGSYETRITVKSQDEVGLLAENFNRVAEAVSEKIGELQGMVRKRDQLVISFPKADGWSGCRESSLI